MAPWILTLVIFSPLAGAVWLLLGDPGQDGRVRGKALISSLVTAFLTMLAVFLFYDSPGAAEAGRYCLEKNIAWIGASPGSSGVVEINYHVGIDGISLWLLVLTSFLTPLAIWASFSGIRTRVREYYTWMLVLQTGMLGVFCSLDLLLFYVFFEFTLVPLYFLIGIWGGPLRREAANKFFIYTLAGSVLTFAAVLYLAYFAYANSRAGVFTFDIQKLTAMGQSGAIPVNVQWWLFAAFAAGFAIKVPLFPVHTWLPLAHTEAPTAGSVILAGVLLKLGTYGFTRLSLPMLPDATVAFAPFMATLAVIGIIYGALAAWVQDDVKKLVAYSSVSHLGFCMLGLFSLKVAGVTGAVLYMVNHGLSTGALFLVVGMVYERYHTRDINKIGGLARPMPWMAFFLIFFTLSSVALPGLNGFVSEFLVLLGTATSAGQKDGLIAGPLGYAYVVPAALGIILGAVYMFWMCQRVLFGPLTEPPHTPDTSGGLKTDLTRREIGILAPIAVVCLILGVFPKPVLETLQASVGRHILAHREIPADQRTDEALAAGRTGGWNAERGMRKAEWAVLESPPAGNDVKGRLRNAESKAEIADCGLRIADWGSEISDFRLWTADLPTEDSGFRCSWADTVHEDFDLRVRLADSAFESSDFRYQTSGSRSQISASRFQISDLRFEISNFHKQLGALIRSNPRVNSFNITGNHPA